MNTLNPKVDLYIADGCGRCEYYATAKCKVRKWQPELETLRQVVIEAGLKEELKWGVPCYTFNGKNIVVVSAFKTYCSLSFFKGALLQDSNSILDKTSESMQSARLIKFKNTKEIIDKAAILKSYLLQAIEIEKAGLKVAFQKNPEPVPEELLNKFEGYPALKKAFYNLTPGRQRGYIIYFSQPKQTNTRTSRIEKCMHQIMNGKGLNDNYHE
jgi:uncharacterized protein YdeI (YjbR/CyaY-like superfamily)